MNKKSKDKTIVLCGRMAFISVNAMELSEKGDGVDVLGLFERYEHRVNKFTNQVVETVDQLNILEYIKESLNIYGYYGKKVQVSVRYLISDKPIEDAEQVIAEYIGQLEGDIHLEHGSHFSDLTGYLWTDSELKVGGHDLLKELESFLADPKDPNWRYRTYDKCIEKYLWLEITRHDMPS